MIDIRRDGYVTTVVLTPTGAMTTLSRELASELLGLLQRLADDDAIRCLVIRGTGRSFAVGADLKEIRAATVAENLDYNALLIEVNERIANMPFPVIACINGHALGGGLELALACSVRVSAETARFGLPEVRVGILPGAGGTVRLPRVVPRGAAMRMLLSGAMIDASEAHRIGLVDVLVPPEEVVQAACALAEEMAASAPLAIRAVLAAIRDAEEADLADAVRNVHNRLKPLVASEDTAEGIDSFLEKRPATFRGR